MESRFHQLLLLLVGGSPVWPLESLPVLSVWVLPLHLRNLENLPLDAPVALRPLPEGSNFRCHPQTPAPTLADH